MKKVLTVCMLLLMLLVISGNAFCAETKESLEAFFANEQRAPGYVDEADRKVGYDETWLESPVLVSSAIAEILQEKYGDKNILAGNVHQLRMVDGQERMVLLFEGPFDFSSASYGLTVFLSQGKTLYRCNLKTLQKEVFYQGENSLSSLVCTEEWGYFLDGNTLVFYHTPSDTFRKIDLSEVGGSDLALGDVQIDPRTSRFLSVRVPNKLYDEAFAAAGVAHKNEMVKTPERFAAWIWDTLGDADITAETIENAKIDFDNICSYWLHLYKTVASVYDLKTEAFLDDAATIDSPVYKELMAELSGESQSSSEGTDTAGEDAADGNTQTDPVPTDGEPSENTEKGSALWVILGIGSGVLICGGVLLLLFRKKK